MKNSLLAIALAVATMPLTFAAQTKPAVNPPASSTSSVPANKTTVAATNKKTPKVHKKAPKKSATPASTASTVKPK